MSFSGKGDLVQIMDEFYRELLDEARSGESDAGDGNSPRIGFNDKLKLFSEGRAWVAVKNKVAPDDDSDPFSDARAKLVGGVRRGGPPAKAPNGHG